MTDEHYRSWEGRPLSTTLLETCFHQLTDITPVGLEMFRYDDRVEISSDEVFSEKEKPLAPTDMRCTVMRDSTTLGQAVRQLKWYTYPGKLSPDAPKGERGYHVGLEFELNIRLFGHALEWFLDNNGSLDGYEDWICDDFDRVLGHIIAKQHDNDRTETRVAEEEGGRIEECQVPYPGDRE